MRRNGTLVVAFLVVLSSAVFGVAFVSGGTDRQTLDFTERAQDIGLSYRASESVEGNGRAGAYVTDFDDDGWPDLLLIGGTEPRLFHNDGGTFEASGELPAVNASVKSALALDYDDDGLEDLLLLPVDGSPLMLHNTGGSFENVSLGLDAELTMPTGATVADFDRNGCPDVFVIQNGDWSNGIPRKAIQSGSLQGDDNGRPNMLFMNDCTGFERRTDAGISGHRWSLATSAVDLNGDGYPDIHVGNDWNRDVVYLNQGNGTFDRRELGPATDRHAMSSEVFDANGDGTMDLFVTNIHLPRQSPETLAMPINNRGNNLLLSNGNGTFTDRGDRYGVRKGGWGWAAVAADFDGDMDVDLLHATQSYRTDTNNDGFEEFVETPPAVWERTGDRFERRNASELGFLPSNGRGVAATDFDRDGDVDVVISDASGRFKLYENAGSGGSIQLDVVTESGRTAVGAHVTVATDTRTRQFVVTAGSDFLSQDSRTMHVGMGAQDSATRIRIEWPDGSERTFENVEAGERLVISPAGIERALSFEESSARWVMMGSIPFAVLSVILIGTAGTILFGYRKRSHQQDHQQ